MVPIGTFYSTTWDETEFTSSHIWQWAAYPTVVFLLCSACPSPRGNGKGDVFNHCRLPTHGISSECGNEHHWKLKHQEDGERGKEHFAVVLISPFPFTIYMGPDHFRHHYPQVSYQVILKWLPSGSTVHTNKAIFSEWLWSWLPCAMD